MISEATVLGISYRCSAAVRRTRQADFGWKCNKQSFIGATFGKFKVAVIELQIWPEVVVVVVPGGGDDGFGFLYLPFSILSIQLCSESQVKTRCYGMLWLAFR